MGVSVFCTVDLFLEIPLAVVDAKTALSLLLLSQSQSKTDGDGNTHTHVCKYKSISS
jgi:hypothetical protein